MTYLTRIKKKDLSDRAMREIVEEKRNE
jgi:hypothetical protein